VCVCECVFLSRSAQDKFLFSVMAYANGDGQIDFRDKDVDLQGHFPLVSACDFWISIALSMCTQT